VAIERRLEDGELVELGGRRLRAVHRPGHSPTDTLFVDEAAAVAFAGDHLIGHISSNPVAHRPLEGPDDPALRPPALVLYLASLQATAAMGRLRLLPGHGEPIEDPAALIAERLAHHRERCEAVARIVAAGPVSAHGIARAIWGDLALRQALLTLSEVLGHVDLLVRRARAHWVREGELMLVAPC
jgi:glyoxylase-like metal-dependent hydrolase (beta-lactamase superfamily II)